MAGLGTQRKITNEKTVRINNKVEIVLQVALDSKGWANYAPWATSGIINHPDNLRHVTLPIAICSSNKSVARSRLLHFTAV